MMGIKNKLMDLTEDELIEIHRVANENKTKTKKKRLTQRQIGKKYGISGAYVSRISNQLDYYIQRNGDYQGADFSGHKCSSCGSWFVAAHGQPVYCKFCVEFRRSKGQPVDKPMAWLSEEGL